MYYYKDTETFSYTFCSHLADLPFPRVSALPVADEILYLFRRPPLSGRDSFSVTHPRLLTDREGTETLSTRHLPEVAADGALTAAIEEGRVRAVNLSHPRWRELLVPFPGPGKKRVHLLALGDVGSTLLTGLRLMGGDVISSIGICDVRPGVADRWALGLRRSAGCGHHLPGAAL